MSFVKLLETVKQDPEELNLFAPKVNNVEFNKLSLVEAGFDNIIPDVFRIPKIQNIKEKCSTHMLKTKKAGKEKGEAKKENPNLIKN